MAAYKKIQGTSIRPEGGKPSTNRGGVIGHIKSGVHVKGSTTLQGVGKESFFMGKQANGPETVYEARGKHLVK